MCLSIWLMCGNVWCVLLWCLVLSSRCRLVSCMCWVVSGWLILWVRVVDICFRVVSLVVCIRLFCVVCRLVVCCLIRCFSFFWLCCCRWVICQCWCRNKLRKISVSQVLVVVRCVVVMLFWMFVVLCSKWRVQLLLGRFSDCQRQFFLLLVFFICVRWLFLLQLCKVWWCRGVRGW